MATFGIVEAAQRARVWAPTLDNAAQRLVLFAVVLHMNADSTADPTVAGQLDAATGYSARYVRKVLRQLEELGAITPVGSRPVFDKSGRGRGGKVTLWSIPPGPPEDLVAPGPPDDLVVDSHLEHQARPPGPPGAPNRNSGDPPLRTEKAESVHETEKPSLREQIAAIADSYNMENV